MPTLKTLYIDLDNVLVDFPSAFPHVEPSLLEKYLFDRFSLGRAGNRLQDAI